MFTAIVTMTQPERTSDAVFASPSLRSEGWRVLSGTRFRDSRWLELIYLSTVSGCIICLEYLIAAFFFRINEIFGKFHH